MRLKYQIRCVSYFVDWNMTVQMKVAEVMFYDLKKNAKDY